MPDLATKLEADCIKAAKSRQAERLNTLRYLKAVLKNEEIAKRGQLTDVDVIKALKREAKRRQEAIDVYERGNRPDLKAKEEAELAIIKEYLPAEMPLVELKAKIEEIIKENKLEGQRDFNQAMKLVMAAVAGQAQGATISQLVKELLSSSGETENK